MKDQVFIEVYSDGSGNTFASDGGWGYVIRINGEFLYEESGYLPIATNNTAELTAAIKGLEYVMSIAVSVGARVELISDSQLVLGYASGKWKCKAIHLATLCVQLRKLYSKLNCSQRWERGHQGEVNNERCDELAKSARLAKG